MDDYLSKPINSDLLAQALERCARRFDGAELAGDAPDASEDALHGLDGRALERLREMLGDQLGEMLPELIELYLSDASGTLAAARQAIASQTPDELRRAAHTLKSTSATFGALQLADLCRELEHQSRGAMPADAPAALEQITSELAHVTQMLRALERDVRTQQPA